MAYLYRYLMVSTLLVMSSNVSIAKIAIAVDDSPAPRVVEQSREKRVDTTAKSANDAEPASSRTSVSDDAWTDETWADDNWGEDNWDDSWQEAAPSSPWTHSGFVELGYGVFTQDNVTDKQQSLAELRAQLDSQYQGGGFSVTAKVDAFADQIIEKIDYDVRLLNISVNAVTDTDIIVGRQVITWGTGDYLFLNDLFAKDWQSFFAGRHDAYLKAPNDAIRVLHYIDDVTIDVVYVPEFTADNYITGERFSFYSPMQQAIVAADAFDAFMVQSATSEQYALRLATTVKGIEYGLYAYKGLWTTPVGLSFTAQGMLENYFPKLHSYGASVRAPAFGGLLNSEFAIYNSIEDSAGNNPFIANDQIRLLLGYERELASNLTGAMQFYLEHTKDHRAYLLTASNPDIVVAKNRQVVTLRLMHQALQQTLTSNLFLFYSPTDDDAYIKPSVSYRYSDNWQLSAGANIFVGDKTHTFFGQHQDNSNVWVRFRYRY